MFPYLSVYQGKAVDGIKITQMLKANAQTAKLPIILVTAHAMEGDRENFLSRVVLMATFRNRLLIIISLLLKFSLLPKD